MNNDIATLAREVAEEYAAGGSPSLSVGEVETALDTLARAVLRVADLADGYIERYDRRPDIEGDYPQGVVVTAKAIRAALNGDTND